MKRINSYTLFVLLLCALGQPAFLSPVVAQSVKTITILHTNDTHSRIEPVEINSPDKDLAGKGGYVRRATYINEVRQQIPNLLLFDCGDFS
ncbi:MAG: bifunctional metallophosphatase/5'-nucleotidase, partial [Bacteroides graminisolvens]